MKNIICFLFGHQYRLKQHITKSIREVKCTRCKKEWGMEDRTQSFIPLDAELIALHKDLKPDYK